MGLAVVQSAADQEPLSLSAEVEHGVEVAVDELDGEEVRPAAARTGHHQHPVALDRLEVELDAALAARGPLRQTEVRPSRGEGDGAHSGARWTPRGSLTGGRSGRPSVPALDDNIDPVRLGLRKVDQVQIGRQKVADHQRLQINDKDVYYNYLCSKP